MPNIPERFMADHLFWTNTGEVWATWRLQSLPRPVTEIGAQTPAVSHAALLRSLVDHEFLLLGLLTWTDPVVIADRMLQNVDLAANPMWATETDASIDRFASEALGERHWFLSVRLTGATSSTRARTMADAAFNEFAAAAGIAAIRPGSKARAEYRRTAEHLEQSFPEDLHARPATEDEQIWIRRHLQSRTGYLSLGQEEPGTAQEASGVAAFGSFELDEGARTDLSTDQQKLLTKHLLRNRHLKIIDDAGTVSYQAGLVLSKVPKQMLWPTTEFLARIDDTGVPVDVAIRGVVRSRHAAMRRNQQAMKQLTDQLDHAEGAEASHSGLIFKLNHASDVLTEYQQELEQLDREVEVEPVCMVSIGAHDSGTVEELATQFVTSPKFDEFTWARPVGIQKKIFWAMRPGGRMSAHVRDYRQITRSGVFATALPLTEHRLGRRDGVPMAINESSSLLSMVYVDLVADAREDNTSPTLAVVGEQGSGKSAFQKRMCAAFVARGGRMIATDNSTEREWVHFAEALDCSLEVVDTARPTKSMDPLRVLPPELAGPVTQSFLITLMDVHATDQLGQSIAKALKPAYLAEHGISSLGQFQRHMGSKHCQLPGAAEIADRIGVFSDLESEDTLARAVFDESLPPMDIDSRAIIIATSNVELPSQAELSTGHLFRQMSVEKIFGRAVYALIGRLAKEVCFADRSDPAIFDVDEAHHMTTSPEATQVLKDFVRFGRRQMAAFIIGTHDPEGDIPDATVRGLIKHRVVLRLTDTELSEGGTRFLGIDESKSPQEFQSFTAQIRGLSEPGTGLYRDRLGRVGRIRLLLPATPEHREAALTTPPTREEAGV